MDAEPMIGLVKPGTWTKDALCATNLWPDAWFSEWSGNPEHDQVLRDAKRVCRVCPVRRECYEAGIGEEFGVWGGETKNKRAPERREAKKAPPQVDATDARSRLQALATLGWISRDVATDIRKYTGIRISPKLLDSIRDGGTVDTYPEVVAAVERAYGHLKGRAGSGICANAMTKKAREEGWTGPRDIDDAVL